jgi:hypothetical protein
MRHSKFGLPESAIAELLYFLLVIERNFLFDLIALIAARQR